jgi:hypothetical protein
MLMVAEWAGRVRASASPGTPIIDDEGVAKMGIRFVLSQIWPIRALSSAFRTGWFLRSDL